jgi:hypothetical protein
MLLLCFALICHQWCLRCLLLCPLTVVMLCLLVMLLLCLCEVDAVGGCDVSAYILLIGVCCVCYCLLL